MIFVWKFVPFVLCVSLTACLQPGQDGVCPEIIEKIETKNVPHLTVADGHHVQRHRLHASPANVTAYKCCDGYGRVDDSCVPLCSEGCIGGTCTAPETCSCHDGYRLRGGSPYICHKSCVGSCPNGTCLEPCSCDSGYVLDEEFDCVPVCSRPCLHGACVLPETCHCDDGYDLDESSNVCVATCSEDCIDGYCSARDTCTCSLGYEISPTNKFKCDPVCSGPCENGYCSAPDKCACFDGYYFNDTRCRPFCSNCTDGDCVEPETCRSRSEDGSRSQYRSSCPGGCIQGRCSDGACICDDGWSGPSCNIQARDSHETEKIAVPLIVVVSVVFVLVCTLGCFKYRKSYRTTTKEFVVELTPNFSEKELLH